MLPKGSRDAQEPSHGTLFSPMAAMMIPVLIQIAYCSRPKAPTPMILPNISSRGFTVDTITSMMRELSLQPPPDATILPYMISAV